MKSMTLQRGAVRLVALATVFAVALPAAAGAPDGKGPFVDTDGLPYEDSVAALWGADITTGCSEWLFCPEEAVSRAEMAAFLARAFDLEASAETPFTDVEASIFEEQITAIAAAEITVGCSATLFCPDRHVTRAEMASFMARAFELPPSAGDPFTDDDADVHEDDIARIAAAGITMGCAQARFCPGRPVTRAEVAAFLARGLDLSAPDDMPVIPAEALAEHLDEMATPVWPVGSGAEGWRPLVELYFEPGDVDRAIRIMACESKGDPSARNPSSGASGLFQHMPTYWADRSTGAGFGGHSIFDPVANVAVAAWLVYDYPGGGWQHWVCRG